MITHYDLFAGIGGFSLALDEVFNDESIKHIFCEWESFPTAILKKHWPEGEYWGDIADLVAHTRSTRLEEARSGKQTERSRRNNHGLTILTGGFPCQPFSHAGRRKGTADDRYKWPEMFAVIKNVKPEWVIAENVRGLTTWNDGMVLETVCSDLESQGYEVQPFIIPAVAVNAPHRRDRVWIIAHRNHERAAPGHREVQETDGEVPERHDYAKSGNTDRPAVTDTRPQRREQGCGESLRPARQEPEQQNRQYPDWSRNWREVAASTCVYMLDDGFSRELGGTPLSYAKWRKEGLKAMGNAIVPQVAMEIFRAIKLTAPTHK